MVTPATSSLQINNNPVSVVKKDLAVEELARDKKIDSKIEGKLSAIGQELIRNNPIKSESLSRFN